MKQKLINNFTSRPFLVLLIAVIAFFVTDKFTENGLILTFALYCGYNVADKFVKKEREHTDFGRYPFQFKEKMPQYNIDPDGE